MRIFASSVLVWESCPRGRSKPLNKKEKLLGEPSRGGPRWEGPGRHFNLSKTKVSGLLSCFKSD